jgi:multidrug resistance efflux pump
MNTFFTKEILGHPYVLSAIGAVVVVGIGSGIYYMAATREPVALPAAATNSALASVIGSGTVEPAQNPDLAFESGGRVAQVSVAVGDTVAQGQVLAILDTASLSAQRAQAAANLQTQQATLAQLQAGPRQVDIDAKTTAVDQATGALANLRANISTAIAEAYDQSFSGVAASTDTLFNQANSSNPALAFSTTDSQLALNAVTERIAINSDLAAWGTDLQNTSLDAALAHVQLVRAYADAVLLALGSATPSNSFPQSTIAANQAAVGGFRDTINGLILSLQGQQQQIASDQLNVQSAQDALNQTLAGATPQDIEAQTAQVAAAQANVANFDAQLRNAMIVAPFAGTVASVHVKTGDIIAPDTAAVSLNPESALQIVVYFSEIDIAKIKTGDAAAVTLDAYGSAQTFAAQVVSVDTSPTAGLGYKATLQFLKSDPAISSGMTANVTISI